MATVKMKRLSVIGVKPEKKLILEVLTKSGCFEVSVADKPETQEHFLQSVQAETDLIAGKQAKAAFAIEYLNALNEEASDKNKESEKLKKKAEKKQLSYSYEPYAAETLKNPMARPVLGYDDYYDIKAGEYDILSVCSVLEKISFDRLELRSQIHKLNVFNRNIAPYSGADIPFSCLADTKSAAVMLALGPKTALKESLNGLNAVIIEYPSELNALWGIVCLKEQKQAVTDKLTALGFSLCNYRYEKTAQQIINENNAEIQKLEEKSAGKLREGLSYLKYLPKLKTLYDIFGLEAERSDAERGFLNTEATFTVEGWAPSSAADKIVEKLKETTAKIYIECRDPQEGEEPPTLMHNPKVITPFESVTNNYSPPLYGELDPTPVMGFFFFVFFGIMLGDAGYGLMLALGAFLIAAFVKVEKGFKQSLLMFGICGISAIIFGILFGGVFAIEAVPPLWFNPLKEPIMMLAFSLALGAVQLLSGYTFKTVKKIRSAVKDAKSQKERVWMVFDGILDSLFIYTLFGSVLCFLMPMLFPDAGFPFSTVGLVLLIVTLAGIVLTAGRENLRNKKIGGYFASGFAGLYGLVGIFSDVLSYSRLFGLALSGGAIAMAFNQIGTLLFGLPIIGYVLGAVVLVALHVFNFALSALGAYVHDIRLQYVEFFGKFYDGDGRTFNPLGENTKYVRFAEIKAE